MAVRSDVTVDWTVSPRIVTVASPSTNISIQDLHDTLVVAEAALSDSSGGGQDQPQIVSSGGKEVLDAAGTRVGITCTLLNAKLAFQARPGPTFVQCIVDGGNLVAQDAIGDSVEPIQTTAYTQVVRTSSSSATLLEQQSIANIQYLLESLRPHHTGQGNIFYWDPIGGDDSFDGSSRSNAVATFARAHDLAEDGNHDVIMALADSGVMEVEADETIHITKNFLFLRGPGRDFHVHPTSTTEPTIKIDAVGVEVSSLVVHTANSGGQNGIEVLDGADFFFLDHLWSRDVQGSAVEITGSNTYGRINGCFFAHSGAHGIHINGNVRHVRIRDTELDANTLDGIRIEGTTARNNLIEHGTKVYDNDGYGIRILAPALRNFIDADVARYDNTLGNMFDTGVGTIDLPTANEQALSNATDIHRATFNKMVTDPVAGTWTIYDLDDTTPLFTGTLYEDAAGTQTYRGQGAERRERAT